MEEILFNGQSNYKTSQYDQKSKFRSKIANHLISKT